MLEACVLTNVRRVTDYPLRLKEEALPMKWYLRACPACGGDLHEDLEDQRWVVCFLCARSFTRDEALGKPLRPRARRQLSIADEVPRAA